MDEVMTVDVAMDRLERLEGYGLAVHPERCVRDRRPCRMRTRVVAPMAKQAVARFAKPLQRAKATKSCSLVIARSSRRSRLVRRRAPSSLLV